MSLTGSKLIHANSATPGAVPTAGQMTQGQFAQNTADSLVFIKNSAGAIVAVASAAAYALALSSVQTVNGQTPTAGDVTLTPAQIGTFGVAPLDAGSKIPTAYLPASVLGNVDYVGTWDASTNTPTLPDPTTNKGNYYVVETGGTQTGAEFDGGSLTFNVGDWVISNGTIYQKVTSENLISSVNGQTGIVVLTAASVGALDLTGGTLSGTVTFTAGTVTGLAAPTADSDAATKLYVDTAIAAIEAGEVVSVTSNNSALTAVTTTGAVVLDFATQAANTVFAGPASGADATPTFRALANADIAGLTLDEGTFA